MEKSNDTPAILPVGEEQIAELLRILLKYKKGKASIDSRVISAENWWRLRNEREEAKLGHVIQGFHSSSGWLHSVIQNKYADCMEAYPEPNILPREEGDAAEARMLSRIIPCVLEQNRFESVYADCSASCKTKFGTGVYKVIWDRSKLGGLGDISVRKCNILNLFWEPGVEDIQQSRYFFEVDMQDEEEVKELFPQLEGRVISKDLFVRKMPLDDSVDFSGKVPVISCYYRRRGLLHYCLFVPGALLFASENEPEYAEKGWYDHGLYPYVFDPLFRVEGSPCGYGYVDLCCRQQTEIDLLKTAYIENAMVGAKPRYFRRAGCGVNEEQFCDLSRTLVDVEGSLDDTGLRPIDHDNLDGNYISMLTLTVDELREIGGATDASMGAAPAGVTSASGIAALQEAAGKGSRAGSMGTYRAYSEIINLVIELIRQFYDLPRCFRITGDDGEDSFVSYTNAGLKPVPLTLNGQSLGYRLPVFDIRVIPQRRSAYSKTAENDLAMKLYQLGFFDPARADQALACLSMMDFDRRDEVRRIVSRGGDMAERFRLLLDFSKSLAGKHGDENALMMLSELENSGMRKAKPNGSHKLTSLSDNREHPFVTRARQQSATATAPRT